MTPSQHLTVAEFKCRFLLNILCTFPRGLKKVDTLDCLRSEYFLATLLLLYHLLMSVCLYNPKPVRKKAKAVMQLVMP